MRLISTWVQLCRAIRQKKEDEIRAKLEIKAQAQAFAQALATIGKFNIKKKVSPTEESNQHLESFSLRVASEICPVSSGW